MKKINLGKDFETIVDDEIFERLNCYKWYRTSHNYPVRESVKEDCNIFQCNRCGYSHDDLEVFSQHEYKPKKDCKHEALMERVEDGNGSYQVALDTCYKCGKLATDRK